MNAHGPDLSVGIPLWLILSASAVGAAIWGLARYGLYALVAL